MGATAKAGRRVWPRVVGSWIAASAILVLALIVGYWDRFGPQ